MCGRFAQSEPAVKYARMLDPTWDLSSIDLQPSWNLAPGRQALVFYDDQSAHTAELLHWGFIPAWAETNSYKANNARVETAATKPYFRKAWKSGRCLIPADGWYEWQLLNKQLFNKVKRPFFIHRADNQPMLMAGLFESNPHVGVTSFAVLTTDADNSLREVHHRKPVVLSAESGLQWIKPSLANDEIDELAQASLSADHFAWHTV